MPREKVSVPFYGIETEWGRFAVSVGGAGVKGLCFPGRVHDIADTQDLTGALAKLYQKVAKQLLEYLSGKRQTFSLQLDLSAGTAFQQEVWQALREIPYAQTVTYGDIARKIGRPRAFQAVGGACGANPVSVIVPCHRVLAGNGLGGFSSGLPVKQRLLVLEKKFQNG